MVVSRGRPFGSGWIRGIGGITLAAALLSGCASLKTPERLYDPAAEFTAIRGDVDADTTALKSLKKKEARHKRNEIIAARKYSIDLQYTQYETALTHEAQAADFAAKAATIALGTTAEFIPVDHTARMLSGIGTGAASLDSAYNEKVLRAQLIQDVQSAMRAGRHERAAVIYANMRCSVKTYPLAMALSDLEAYYRAGTFPAGLIKLSHTVTKEENNTAATAEAEKSGNSDAQAKLAGMALEADIKAQAAVRGKPKGAHKCSLVDDAE
jgi:hypothetical protein